MLFSAHQVRRLTGLSIAQLRYWDQTRFFTPEYSDERFGPYSHVYSFRDVVGLYTVGLLRKRHGFPLQQLRPVGEFLSRFHETPWSGLSLYVSGRDIAFEAPGQGGPLVSARLSPGQALLNTTLHLERVARHVEAKAKRLRRRRPGHFGKIQKSRHILGNSAVIAGTRIRTRAVWNFHRAGFDAAAIIREYPRLRGVDIAAALAYESKKQSVK
jgi:uncharacterized protein (DUF433 family)